MIFFLILICVITSSFVIDFSYGLYQNYHIIKEDAESDLTSMTISFNNTEEKYASKKLTGDTLLSFSDELNDGVSFYDISIKNEDDLEDAFWLGCNVTIKDGHFAANEEYWKNIGKGTELTDEQEANGEHVAIFWLTKSELEVNGDKERILSHMPDDETFILFGEEYKIIGIGGITLITVPFESLKDDVVVEKVSIEFDHAMVRSQYDEIKEKMLNAFGDIAQIPELDLPDARQYYLYNTVMIIAVMIALLSAINFAVLYRYILSKRLKALAIFRICGCTKPKALGIFLSECMIMTIPAFLLTTVAYDKLVLPVLANHFEYIKSAYSIKLYLIIFAIYTAVSLLVLMIMIYFNFLKKSITAIKGEN